jgi:hypothetical protein
MHHSNAVGIDRLKKNIVRRGNSLSLGFMSAFVDFFVCFMGLYVPLV